ncbi:MAG: S41 family peptidase [Parasporobacterium sp.]|nr:S41 family peptidase [Parasporobacterium sp.]
MRRKRLGGLTGILIGMVIGALICVVIINLATVKSTAMSVKMDTGEKIQLILDYLSNYYIDIDKMSEEDITDALAKGLMENIGDKYAQYYTAEQFNELMEDVNGEYAGIGVLITQDTETGKIIIYQVYDDTPAQEAGIQIMDQIVEAAGRRDFETMDELVSLVRGEPGTTVDIVVDRGGTEIPMTVERRYIKVPSAAGEMLDDTLGYIQIAEFNVSTVSQFEEALDRLAEEGMQKLIIDLRDNPGGDYDSVVAMCDRVVPEGPIVTIENRAGSIKTENSDATCLDIPMAILINGNTASAAELFTMCLTDYGKAETIGTTSFGKGIVQAIYRLPDGSGLKFTTERYYGPAGNSIQDTGIEPDYYVEIPEEAYDDGVIYGYEDTQLIKAAEILGYSPDSVEVLTKEYYDQLQERQ